MLQQMRGFAKSWISSIFLGLLALSFGVWGIADIFRGNTDTSVATVGGIKIEQSEFQREYQTALKNLTARTGSAVSAEKAKQLGLPDETLQRMISRTAMDLVVHRLGLTASDADVAAQIRELPAFQGDMGSFDRNRFLQVLNQSGFTEQSFVNAVRADIARAQLTTATADGLQMPSGYAKAIFDYLNEVRAVTYITIPASAAGSVPPPTDAQLEVFIRRHAAHFSTPEYRELTYASVTPAALAPQIEVTDKELHNQYQLNIAKYQQPEKRVIEQITFPTLKDAQAAEAKLGSGFSFEDLAAQRGLKPSDYQLGALAEADLPGDRGKAAFSLQPGQVSKPVKGAFGYVIMKVTAVDPGMSKSFDQVKPELLAQARQTLGAQKISDIVNKFEDAQSGGDTLTEAAKAAGMELTHVKAVDREGLTPDGSKAQIPQEPQFLKQVFAADVGAAGDPFQTADGSAYVLKVEGIVPPKLKPLDAVRQQAVQQWTADKTQEALLHKAQALTAEANRDHSLDAVAKQLNVAVEHSPGLQRGAATAQFPSDLLGNIFDAPPGTSVLGRSPDGSGFIVARVVGVAHPPAAMEQLPQYVQFRNQLGNQIGADVPASFAMAARQQVGVTINKKNFDSAVGGGS